MNGLRGLLAASVLAGLMVLAAPAMAGSHAADPCCAPAPVCCEPAPVCCPCPPPPVEVTWCVKDPVTCCTHEVTACVPACCAGEIPCLDSCSRGFLGRRVLTYKFQCCGHCVDVVITHFGKVIVRD